MHKHTSTHTYTHIHTHTHTHAQTGTAVLNTRIHTRTTLTQSRRAGAAVAKAPRNALASKRRHIPLASLPGYGVLCTTYCCGLCTVSSGLGTVVCVLCPVYSVLRVRVYVYVCMCVRVCLTTYSECGRCDALALHTGAHSPLKVRIRYLFFVFRAVFRDPHLQRFGCFKNPQIFTNCFSLRHLRISFLASQAIQTKSYITI